MLQVLLLGTCAYLLYAAVAPAFGAGVPAPARIPDVEERAAGQRPWSHYQIIGQRNLFRSASAAPPIREPSEEIAESKLRMKLHATITGERESLATLEDLSTHERFYVRPGDSVGTATVEWIERRKVVILNQGRREAITMDDDNAVARPATAKRAQMRPRAARNRVQRARERLLSRLSRNAREPAPVAEQEAPALTDQATFSRAAGAEGLRVTKVVSGSPLGDAGLTAGVICTSLNGVQLTDVASLAAAAQDDPELEDCLVCVDPDQDGPQSYCF